MKTENSNENFDEELSNGVREELKRLDPFQRYLTEQFFGLGGSGERSLQDIASRCGADSKEVDEELTNVLRELRRAPKESNAQSDLNESDFAHVSPMVQSAQGEVAETLNWVVLLQTLQEGRSPLNGARH